MSKPHEIPRYTGRREEVVTIEKPWAEGAGISFEGGIGTGGQPELAGLPAGTRLIMEQKGSRVTGFQTLDADGRWLYRYSDQDVEAEHARFVEDLNRRNREQLEQHRAEWTLRERQLPDWIRARLESFHTTGGEKFEEHGWGYELIVAELAVLYYAQDSLDDDGPEVMELAEREGTSGNQHGVAKLLANVHKQDENYSMAGTPSALTPLTGDRDYSGKQPDPEGTQAW